MAKEFLKRFFLFISTGILLISCQTSSKITDSVQPGMTKEQVLKIAKSKPTYVSQFGIVETWYYLSKKNDEPTTVIRFRENTVLEVRSGENEKSTYQERNRQKRASLPPDLGQSCEFDDDCVSKNCWLNRCAGPHNCFVFLGAQCVIDNDCCEGTCDEGICAPKKP